MTIREELEQAERAVFSPYAAYSTDSKGRDAAEEECDIRPCYQRDRDKILHCKSFRRLKHKTQVFLAPMGDHYRTRLTHTLEVSQIARTIGKALRLNEDLVEAIALGHDLGHTPFGHAGERVLNQLCEGGFKHYEQSRRIVETLEKDGAGLNLTWEVRDGILNHQTDTFASTMEGRVVRFADKMAYIHHDIDDAVRARLMTEEDVPKRLRKLLGDTTKQRLDTLIHDIIENSRGLNDIRMSEEKENAMWELRTYMFETLYTHPVAKAEEKKTVWVLEALFHHYKEHMDLLPDYLLRLYERGESLDRVVCDYIAGMTDQYAVAKFQEYFIPKSWQMS